VSLDRRPASAAGHWNNELRQEASGKVLPR
jgi:hypothetical protein